MPHPVRPFLGESAESRIQNRRRIFIDKSFELMAENNWRNVSIAQLCRDVNLNKRYFYESFQELGELEDAVVEDLISHLLEIGFKSVAEAQDKKYETDALARHVLKACINWLVEDTRRAQVLFGKASDNPRARAHRDAVISQLAQVLTNFSIEYHGAKKQRLTVTEKHRLLAKLGSALLIGGTIESIMTWMEGQLDLSVDEFVDYIANFWVTLGDTAVAFALQTS